MKMTDIIIRGNHWVNRGPHSKYHLIQQTTSALILQYYFSKFVAVLMNLQTIYCTKEMCLCVVHVSLKC